MFKPAKKLFIALFSSVGIFALAGFALAAAPDLGLQFGDAIGLSSADPRIIASNIIRIALGFLGIIAVGLIVYGGFLWMTAAGNEDKIDMAKKLLVSAVIGLVIILSAFGIATFVLNKLLEATGGGSPDGGPCSTSVNSCAPSSALCSVGLTCGADCLCHGTIVPPTPPPVGGPCGTVSFGACVQTANCDANSFCATAGDCTCHPKTCSTSLDPSVCTANPDPAACGSGYYCDPTCNCVANAQEGESCDGDPSTVGVCDGAIGLICDSTRNLFCDVANPDPLKTCTCQPGSGVGVPCGTDPTTCSAGNSICSNQLVCDVNGAACTCQEAPVIDWVSPIGGLCSDDNNKECQVDADCGGAQGVTCNSNTPSAAAGNIISIGGRYFGDTPGTVLFADGSNGTIAGLAPSTVNAACVQYWSDTQVVIVVPTGAASGPITIRRSDNKNDITNDSRGPRIKDLQINTTVKPGLCLVNPGTGKLGASVLYNGVNFAAASAAFGNYELSIPAKDSTQINPRTVQAGVPSVVAGNTTTFVSNAGGQVSNYLEFTKIAELNSGPFIASYEPQTGAPGQYVTIRGAGFGDSQGVNKVYFRAASDNEANYLFPEICADSVWGDKQVIVKVPDGLADGSYSLVMVFAGGKEISTNPSVFIVNNALGLSPSLCKISPVLGQVGTTVDLWGEYFGDVHPANSKIRFSSRRDVSGFTSANWGLDTSASGNPRPDKVETSVPNGAVSGGVAVVKNSPESVGNSLNFQVGSCLDAADGRVACGGQECCPSGTPREGNCVANVSDCVSAALTSVYEFDFNTNFDNQNDFFGSCLERSKLLGTCSSGATCPNSPGACSLFPAGAQSQVVGACTDGSCTAKKGCETPGSCVYNQSNNRCVANPPAACGLASTTRDVLNREVPTRCASVKDPVSSNIINRYVFDRGRNSCPPGWIQSLNNSEPICIDQKADAVCAPCGANLTCVPSGLSGVCAAAGEVCPSGSTCQSGECRQDPEASCGCCCRKANEDQDCCAGLTCQGTCGSDAGGTDTNTYGSCGGCANVGTTAADHDAACNCSGTTGKFCDLSDPNFTAGVCRDCAALSSPQECSIHNNTCCVDATKGQNCVNRQFGLGSSDIFDLITGTGGLSYCGRYECVDEAPSLVMQPAGKSFNTQAEAAVGCGPEPEMGASCVGTTTPANPVPSTCNVSICQDARNIFSCLTETGAAAVFQSGNSGSCGVCCCNPANDRCSSLGSNPNLRCQPNVGPSCTGAGRGLCCGCSANADCGNEAAVGCASDTCCRARPGVESIAPADGASNICTNSELRATFDQLMSVESFSGNVIVVGDYISDTCSDGTVYLAADGVSPIKKSFFAKAEEKLRLFIQKPLNAIFGEESLASEVPVSSHNYCAVKGSVSGEQEAGKTVLTFRPSTLLKANTKYFVIIKGDADLKNSQDSVRSLWDIGMNTVVSPVDNAAVFNGINYKGAYIWSFTTLSNTTANPKGICAVDHAKIVPNSYLIQKTDNDKNENDTDSSNENFDTVADSDKAFTVQALSRDNQVLHSVSGYAWQWNWTIENAAVADFVPGVSYIDATGNPITDVSKQLIRAITGVTDNRTKANAVINMIAPTPALDIKASADIYVFVCANPWPPVFVGTWSPWIDAVGNCDALGLSCNNFNYELYYCRDQGSGGPGSDLPTISSDLTWGEGESALKESFFFREGVPVVDSIGLAAAIAPEGGAVDLSWNVISDPANVHTVVKYKVYYGEKSGDLKVSPQQPATPRSLSLRLDGLQNGKTYYAAVTAVYENGAESAYSREVSFTPKKTSLPNTPVGLSAVQVKDENKIEVSWNPNTDDAVSYNFYYGVASGQYGAAKNVKATSTSFIANNAEATYYLTVTALDKYGNESARAREVLIQLSK